MLTWLYTRNTQKYAIILASQFFHSRKIKNKEYFSNRSALWSSQTVIKSMIIYFLHMPLYLTDFLDLSFYILPRYYISQGSAINYKSRHYEKLAGIIMKTKKFLNLLSVSWRVWKFKSVIQSKLKAWEIGELMIKLSEKWR